jgi:hypothetical protein
MKKPFAKQIMMGTMALTLIGGGGALALSHDAFAATSASASTPPTTSVAPQKDNQDHHSFGAFREVSAQLLTFLKLDKATYITKSATETLAQIAADQGISRDALKAELTAEVNAKLDKEKTEFAANIDKTIDSMHKGKNGERGGKFHKGAKIDLTQTATLLGFSNMADFKAALVPGKSIADLAAAKGVTVQSVIDLQVNQMVKNLDQALANKKITQAQYDKQKANSTIIAAKIVNDKHNSILKLNRNNNQKDTKVNNNAAAAPTAAPTTTAAPIAN